MSNDLKFSSTKTILAIAKHMKNNPTWKFTTSQNLCKILIFDVKLDIRILADCCNVTPDIIEKIINDSTVSEDITDSLNWRQKLAQHLIEEPLCSCKICLSFSDVSRLINKTDIIGYHQDVL